MHHKGHKKTFYYFHKLMQETINYFNKCNFVGVAVRSLLSTFSTEKINKHSEFVH